MTEDHRRHAPATERNREPIAQVLAGVLPASGMVLEIASGTGEHALHFARRFPALTWQPSDPSPDALRSIAAWSEAEPLANLAAPLELDAASSPWPVGKADAIVCINMIQYSCYPAKSTAYDACVCINMVHISDWAATVGLFRGCASVLRPGAPLVLYGPYIEDDRETAPSNLEFDRSLKERNPDWGLRNLADVDRIAAEFGFSRTKRVQMPANNLTVIYSNT